MEILVNAYISKHPLEIDSVTGLKKEIHATSFSVDSKLRCITVEYSICLVTSTGATVHIIENGSYKREGAAYDALEASTVGQGVKSIISGTISLYPNIL